MNRALNKVKKLLNEDALKTPSPGMNISSGGDDVILLDDSPLAREIVLKIKCHGIVNKYKISQVRLSLLCNWMKQLLGTQSRSCLYFLLKGTTVKPYSFDWAPTLPPNKAANIFKRVLTSLLYSM